MTLRATINREALLDGLKFIITALPSRPTMAALQGVRVTADGSGALILSAHAYAVHARAVVYAPGATGEALLPGKTLRDMIAALPRGADVRLVGGADTLTIQGGEVEFRTPTLLLKDYPEPPTPAATHTVSLTAAQLREVIRPRVAVGRDDTLPVLTGIYLHSVDGFLTTAATDRYRLGISKTSASYDGPAALVPARPLSVFATLMAKEPHVTLGIHGASASAVITRPVDPAWVILEAPARTVWIECLGGDFPRYQSLIPTEFSTETEFPRADLAAAVTRVRIAGRRAPVRLSFADDSVIVECGSGRHSSDTYAKATVPGVKSIKGSPSSVVLNESFLRDACASFTGERLIHRVAAPASPNVFTDPDTPGFTYLLMPVRVSD